MKLNKNFNAWISSYQTNISTVTKLTWAWGLFDLGTLKLKRPPSFRLNDDVDLELAGGRVAAEPG